MPSRVTAGQARGGLAFNGGVLDQGQELSPEEFVELHRTMDFALWATK